MRAHTAEFKDQIKLMGREFDLQLTFTDANDEEVVLYPEHILSASVVTNGNLLKSLMRELDFTTTYYDEIQPNTAINVQYGLLIGSDYEYLNLGTFYVLEGQYNADEEAYEYTCYDKMLFTMTDYESLQNGTFPMTVRDFITNLCLDKGLVFANASDTFTNYDKVINEDLYTGLNYTYRDILDECSQVVGGSLCINDDEEVEIRYPNDTNDTIDEEYLKDTNISFGEVYGPVNSIVLTRSGGSDSIYAQDSQSIEDNGLCEIKIEDNQIMNFNNRDEFLAGLLLRLDGLTYSINDYVSTGICYYDFLDRYNVVIGNNTYSCLLLNDEIKITQGLEENIYTERPDESETDYKASDITDRRINQAYIIVNKQNQTIESLTSTTEALDTTVNNNYQELIGKFDGLATTDDITTLTNTVTQLQTDTYTKTEIQQIVDGTGVDGVAVSAVRSTSATFDENGMTYAQTGASTSSTINQSGLQVNSTGDTAEELLFAGYDTTADEALVRVANLYLTRYLGLADWRVEEIEDSTYGQGVGFFYLK